jgi:predicted nucleotidyltransferase
MPALRSLDPRARDALLRELRALAARLAVELGAEAVYLFGSLGRGEQHEGSDIDLLVVAPYRGRALDAIGLVLARTELPVEPLVIRPEALARRLEQGHPLYVRILREAIQLHPPAGAPGPSDTAGGHR